VDEVSPRAAVFGVEQARRALDALHQDCGLSWRRIAALGQFSGVGHSTLWRFARLGIVPRKRQDRVLLGLVQRRPRKPKTCPVCGAPVG
jgi:hypothetical protein